MARTIAHDQPYYPQWTDAEQLTFTGTKLADNGIDESGNGTYYVLYCYAWGYADNHPNKEDRSKMNIDWAVDAEGHRVHLPGIHFVKVYTALNQDCGWLGETSTEVMGAVDLHQTGIDTDDIWAPTESAIHPTRYIAPARTRYYDLRGRAVDLSTAPAGIYVEQGPQGALKYVKQ